MVALSYEQWVVAFIVVSTVAKLVVVYVATRQRKKGEPDLTVDPDDDLPDEWLENPTSAASAGDYGGSGQQPRADGSGRSATTARVTECPTCGTENDVCYRYCAECGGDLPTVGPLA